MTELERIITGRIRADGPMPFAAFMSLALYDPVHGYYARGPQRTGWRGHFLTSPELDPAFGMLWANAFRRVWAACGSPDAFEVVEVGPGEGGFAAAVLSAITDPAIAGSSLDEPFRAALTYRLVERVPTLKARQQELLTGVARVEWSPSITELPTIEHGVVFANEVLDNLPVHLARLRAGNLVEVCVTAGTDGLELVDMELSNPEIARWVEETGTVPAEGSIVEVTLAAVSFIAHVGRRLRNGAIVLVDYGAAGPVLAERGGSLLAYSERGVDDDVLADLGERDITAHANWTSVTNALESEGWTVEGPLDQKTVLRGLGARSIDAELREIHAVALDEGRGADALNALSRRQALGALLDPAGLGGLQVVVGRHGIDAPLLSDPDAQRPAEAGL